MQRVRDGNDSGVNNSETVLWDCNGSREQQWTMDPDGTIRIKGKCLEKDPSYLAANDYAELATCNDGANQQ